MGQPSVDHKEQFFPFNVLAMMNHQQIVLMYIAGEPIRSVLLLIEHIIRQCQVRCSGMSGQGSFCSHGASLRLQVYKIMGVDKVNAGTSIPSRGSRIS